ncbi:MAG TPA: hypothetical protein VGE47_14600 [Burkholderiaceae bacterium]
MELKFKGIAAATLAAVGALNTAQAADEAAKTPPACRDAGSYKAPSVIDGKVTSVDAKPQMDSKNTSLNQMFIDSVARAMKETYVCPGNHVFSQEFQFRIS